MALVQLRKRTEARWSPRVLQEHARELGLHPADEHARPRRRGECVDAPRPCPWVSCRHHLALEANPSGSLTIAQALPLDGAHEGHTPSYDDGVDWDAMPETCALDVADRGDHTLEEIGDILGLTRERVRQIADKGLDSFRRRLRFLVRDEGL